jgi:hypothetical protein
MTPVLYDTRQDRITLSEVVLSGLVMLSVLVACQYFSIDFYTVALVMILFRCCSRG